MTADALYDPARGFAGGPRLILLWSNWRARRRVAALPQGITRNIRAAEVGTGVDLTRASIADC